MEDHKTVLGSHAGPVTCVTLSSDSSLVISGSKDNAVVQWDVETATKTFLKKHWRTSDAGQSHEGEVLAVACSESSPLVVSGGRDAVIRVYDTRTAAEVKVLKGHRGAVTSLVFRRGTNTLFSGSEDRCLKQWDLNEMGYLETLFGHQEPVNAIDCWTKEQPLSVSSDRTLRLFKVADQSHLVYRGHSGSIDTVQMLSDTNFVSGGQDGALCLWRDTAKKPTFKLPAAHGLDGHTPRWIVSLASLRMSDLLASGSHDGQVRLWQVDSGASQLRQMTTVAVDGFANALSISPKLLVVGSGSEHRLGRWWKQKAVKNLVTIYRLPQTSSVP